MTLTIELTPEQEARLLAEAEREGVDATAYALRRLGLDTPPAAELTPEQRAVAFHAWANADRPVTPPLSDYAVSRASIYEGNP